ncbi:hypothetical protein MIZ03_4599 [Rhodoferax lithotrophicus]|uniref:Uncharacterized protein n=1 Tax=Rhodoferax lithotrophicus TaxID=2798804 RepID=A0ABN6DCB0_9BURK|nr:hypothetical protein MIZ03_4599 [Rhodoferax sp. MIZ03]
MFEATKSYDMIWLAGIALGLVAAALHFPINDQELQRPKLGYRPT